MMRPSTPLLLVVATGGLMCLSYAESQERPASSETLAHAQRLMEQHELEKAGEVLVELLRDDPRNQEANVELGQVRMAQGLYEDALKSFEAVLSVNPGASAAREGEVKA